MGVLGWELFNKAYFLGALGCEYVLWLCNGDALRKARGKASRWTYQLQEHHMFCGCAMVHHVAMLWCIMEIA